MARPSSIGRVARIKRWILILTLPPAAVALAVGHGTTAAGLAAGGLTILLNLVGTQRAVSKFLEGERFERLGALLLWAGKFGITAMVIFGLLYSGRVGPLALLVGLGSLPVSLLFDIFLFPVNKGEAKKP